MLVVVASVVAYAGADSVIPENWAPKKIMGRDFVVGGVFWPGPASNRPDWAMYRLPSLTRTGWFDTVGLNDILWYKPMPEDKRFKALPYTVDAFFGPTNAWHGQRMREGVAAMERGKDSLYWVRITDSWFPWFMKDSYDCDKASYDEFVKTHKNFVSFGILNESDGSFGADFASVKDPAIKAQMLRDFPLCKKPGDKQRRMAKAMERERAMHFGCSNFCSVYAQNCKWGHLLAKNGVRAWHEYEMEMNASSAPWAFGMFHARGVARQWGVPFTWYTAPLIIGFTRDGQPCNDEWNCVRKGHEKPNLDCGGSISLVKRNCFYGFMAGAAGMEIENTDRCFFDTRDEKNPKPSKYALAFNEMAELCEKTVRGTPYTPVAALTSVYEDFYRFGYNKDGCRDAFAPNAFFFTLVPTLRNDPYRMSDRKKGDQGCLWNSEFGELCDVICPDGGQSSEEFAKVLAPYKWAFLIGGFDDRKDYDLKSVEGWTKAGGTLVCSYDAIADGLVTEVLTGLQVEGGRLKVEGDGWLCDAAGKKIEKFGEKYTFHGAKAKSAKPFLLDDRGTVVAYENAYGKGRVITVMAYQSIPDRFFNVNLPENEDEWFHKGLMSDVSSGRTQFPIQKHLLRLAQRETMPVAVEGDCQWGLNILDSTPTPNTYTYLVWLLNNKGVTKFEREEVTVDHVFDAKVKVTNKQTGKTVEVVVPAGEYKFIQL